MGFRRSPERSSGPILIYYDGYYPWHNSIVVFVSPDWGFFGYYPGSLFLGTFDFLSRFSLDLWVLSLSGLLPRVAGGCGWLTCHVMHCDAL